MVDMMVEGRDCNMSNTDIIMNFLGNNESAWCDDCLSNRTGVTPRQTIYQLCSKLAKDGTVSRYKGECTYCGRLKSLVLYAQFRKG